MTIRFRCSECGKKLKAADDFVGKRVKCSGCETIQEVPARNPSQASDQTWADPVSRPKRPEPEPDPPLNFVKKAVEDDGLDMTPMVDVTFLLLIFFMITAAYSLQKSIELPTPDASEGASQSRTVEEIEQDDDFVIVRIEKDNTVWVNDAEAPSQQELLAKLREAREKPTGASSAGPSKLLVMASGDARHETVVMVLDAGTAAGMEGVRLANADDEL